MSEADLRATARKYFAPFGLYQRIESPTTGKGIPDAFASLVDPRTSARGAAWIEYKYARKWPARERTPIRFDSYTVDQCLWLEACHRNGSRCCIVAQVEDDYALFPPAHVRAVFNGVTQGDMAAMAKVFCRGTFPAGRILKWITGQYD